MTLSRLFPSLAAGFLACLSGATPAAPPDATPPTYSQCQTRGLSDQACHQQIVEAGGVSGSVPRYAQSVTPKNFVGWTEHERWYRTYVRYRKLNHDRILPLRDVIHHHPSYPGFIPWAERYP